MDTKTSLWKISNSGFPCIETTDISLFTGHSDTIEMSGLYTSFILSYGVDENGILVFSRHAVFPMLRLSPNNTHASFRGDIPSDFLPRLYSDGAEISEKAEKFIIDGTLTALSSFGSLSITRIFFPYVSKPAICELITVKNNGTAPVSLTSSSDTVKQPTAVPSSTFTKRISCVPGLRGYNIMEMTSDFLPLTLFPSESYTFSVIYHGRSANDPSSLINAASELPLRRERVIELTSPLSLKSGDKALDTLFAFCKLRAGESVFRTRGGDVHSPGGDAYYAAVWCNDELEYASPWFAYTGDSLLISASYNAFSWYFPFMDKSYTKIPSSVIAEGLDKWDGAGDRGDAAMFLYGGTRFYMTSQFDDKDGKLLNAIKWCAEYCIQKINSSGVIESDSDELEGRLPSGNANLSTNMLAFGGFVSASYLLSALGDSETSEKYAKIASRLKEKCESFFSSTIHGFDTYRYYDGNTTLRSWICLPLCMGIFTRAAGTVSALTSDYLYSPFGQLSEENTSVVWDRSTLYTLRGIFNAGFTDKAYTFLSSYCKSRLLSSHVPYPIEAYPEGNGRQLSAESALFCRIITEGILSIEPLSFTSFSIHPHIPKALAPISLTNIHAFGEIFDITADESTWHLTTRTGKIFSGLCDKKGTVAF